MLTNNKTLMGPYNMKRTFTPKMVSYAVKTALCATLAYMPQSFAAENEAANNDDGIEHIEVTSRHRGESLNKIPLSVVSFGMEEMEKAGMKNVNDIASAAIGFSMEKTFGRQSDIPVIRGVSWIPGFGSQKASYFIDGVYFAGSVQSLPLDLIERVEVVKGPQSALYGRRTFSGAINFITRKPDEDVSGYITGTVGSHDNQQYGAGISAKLTDTLALRASVSGDSYDGDWKNSREDGPEVGGEETNSQMIGLYYTPTENTSISFNYVRNENDDEHSVFHFQGADENNCYLDTRAYYCGEANIDNPISIGGILDNDEYGLRSTREHMSFKLEHTFDFGTLTWTSGKNTYESENGLDQTYAGYDQAFSFGFFFGGPFLGPADVWHTLGEGENEEYSHEIRFSSSAFDDRLLWSVGAYTWHAEDEPEDADAFVAEEDNRAFMAMVSYDVTDDFNVSAEIRRSTDEIKTEAYENLKAEPGFSDVDNEFSSTTTRLIAEYAVNEDTMVYLTRAEGNSPGGFNSDPALPAELIVIEEEEMVMYEAGIKSTLMDGDLYVSAAVYNMDWDKQQLTDSYDPNDGNPPVSYTSNAGKTDVIGIEIEATYIISDHWDIKLGLSRTDAEFKELFDGNHCRIISGLSSADCRLPENLKTHGNLKGNTPPQVPKNEATLAINYSAPVNADWELFGRMDFSYDSSRYAHVHNLIETGSRKKVNLNVGFEGENWTISAWAKNLTDDDTPTYVFRYIDAQSFAYGSRAFPIAPSRGREIGLTASYKF